MLSTHIDSVVFSTPDSELADKVRASLVRRSRSTCELLAGASRRSFADRVVKQCIQEIGYGGNRNAFIANAHSPFINHKHIDAAILVFKQFNVDYVIAVKQVTENHYVHRGLGMESIGNNSYLSAVDKEFDRFYKQIPGYLH